MTPIELVAALGLVASLAVFGFAMVCSGFEKLRREVSALRQTLRSNEQLEAERKQAAAAQARANQILGPGSEY